MSNIKTFTNNIDTNFPVQGRDNPSQGFRDNFAQIKLALITAAEEISTVQTSPGGVFTLTSATSTVLGGVKIGAGFRALGDGTLFIDDIYILPVATPLSLGGVKQGANVAISGDGTLSVADPFVLTTATTTRVGGVKIGSGLQTSGDGTISAFTTPIASSTVSGTVKIGSNISISEDGTISGTAPYFLQAATTQTRGGVIIGSNISVSNNGTISVAAPYVLPRATTSTLGGIIAGSGVSINGSGVISIPDYILPIATTEIVGGVIVGDNLTIDTAGILRAAAPFTLPTASNTTKGGVKIGNGLTIDGGGFLNIQTTPPDLSTVTQSILPGTDITYNLGSATRRWKDLYLSSSTIYLGSNTISSSGTTIVIPGLKITKLGAVAVGVVSTSTTVNGDTRFVINTNFWANNVGVYGPYTRTPVVSLKDQYVSPNRAPVLSVELSNGYIKDIVVANPGFYLDNSFSSVQNGFKIEPASNEPITLTGKSVGVVPPGGGTYTGDFYNQAFTYTWDGSDPTRGEVLVGATTTYGALKTWRQTYGYYKVVGSTLVEVDASQINSGSPILQVFGNVDDSTYFDTPLPFSAVGVGEITFADGKLAASSNLEVAGNASIAGSLTVNTNVTFADKTVLTSATPKLPLYTTSTLNTLVSTATGTMVLVTNLIGGGLPCFYDGTNWKTFSGTVI